jgi:acetylornithine deacetylase
VASSDTRLDAAIDERRADVERFLSALVRSPSVLGAERPAQLLIARRLRAAGLRPALVDVPVERAREDPMWAPGSAARSYAGRPNVIATVDGRGGGRSLVLDGHVDVVSPEPASWWAVGPFSGHVQDGRLFGRGAYDMKGGLVASLWALEAVLAAGVPLRGDVRFESVIEEECTGNGALAARLDAPRADAAIIPECTNLEVFIETPVVLWVEVTVTGRPAYVGRPGEYVNAVERAVELIGRLRSAVPADLTLSVGTIRGGDWPSTVPLECSFVCRVSAPRDWPLERAKAAVEALVVAAAAEDPWLRDHPPTVSYPGFQAEGWALADVPGSSAIRTLVGDVHAAVAGSPLRDTPFPGTADGRYFAARGEPAIYYGPSGGNQHAPDEWVDLESVRLVARVLARTIVEWCA